MDQTQRLLQRKNRTLRKIHLQEEIISEQIESAIQYAPRFALTAMADSVAEKSSFLGGLVKFLTPSSGSTQAQSGNTSSLFNDLSISNIIAGAVIPAILTFSRFQLFAFTLKASGAIFRKGLRLLFRR